MHEDGNTIPLENLEIYLKTEYPDLGNQFFIKLINLKKLIFKQILSKESKI